MFGRISYQLQKVEPEAVWDTVIPAESMWAFPEDASIKLNLEEVYKDHGRFKKRANQLKKWLLEEFSEQKIYEQIVELLPAEEETDIVII